MKILDFDVKIDAGEIVIYGNSDMKYITTYCLKELGIEGGVSYANYGGTYQAPYSNITLQEMSELYKKENVRVLLALNGDLFFNLEYLENVGIHEVYSVRNIWDAVDIENSTLSAYYKELARNKEEMFFFEDYAMNPNKLYLRTIDAVVSERCSLKCESCSNLMQYYKTPKNKDVGEIIEALKVMLHKAECILELRILGGEPFMNLEFVRLIQEFADESKIKKIAIYSNATIFPKEDILNQLKHPKVVLTMSDYGVLSRQLDTWINWCEENQVRYSVTGREQWQDCGKLERHDYTEYQLMDIYGNCECRNLPTLIENKLFGCPYAANAANLGAMYENEMKKDYLLIDENVTATEIDEFLYNRPYLEGCRYCNGRNYKRAKIVPYIQTKTALPYEKLVDCQTPKKNVSQVLQKQDKSLSVIIPTYNMEAYVEKCLHSVMNQTYRNLEIIVIDDGSTDNTVKIIEKCQKDDELSRVHLIKNVHEGVVQARNKGIETATGEYITFVDADDYLADDYLENMIMQMEDCDMICSEHIAVYQHRDIPDARMDRGQGKYELAHHEIKLGTYEGEKIKILLRYMFSNPVMNMHTELWGKIFKKSIAKNIYQKIDTNIFFCEDQTFCQIYMSNCKKVKYVDECGYYYLVRNMNTRYPWDKFADNYERIRKCHIAAFKGHVYEQMLIDGAEQNYMDYMLVKLHNNVSAKALQTRYYYPYYGRLFGKRVILYGAGNVGKWYYKQLLKEDGCIFVAWVDKNAEYLKEHEMLPVVGVEGLDTMEYDYIIIAVYDEGVYQMIRDELGAKGIPQEKLLWNATKIGWE